MAQELSIPTKLLGMTIYPSVSWGNESLPTKGSRGRDADDCRGQVHLYCMSPNFACFDLSFENTQLSLFSKLNFLGMSLTRYLNCNL